MRTIHFVSLGCPKNRVDSEVMVGVAMEAGFRIVQAPEEAEVLVVNTCGFIGEAKQESIDTILELSELKQDDPDKKLVVAGCLSQRYAGELESGLPEVDHFLGSSDMLKLRDVLDGDAARMLVGNPAEWVVRASDPRALTQWKSSAYVKLAEGCNRSCAFCTIPQFRGVQRSRPADDIVREVEQLAAQGVIEINLLSQDTVAYGRDLDKSARHSLASVVERVANVPGVRWTRVFYLYPETLDEALLDLYANHPRVVPYVDMPLQHASDRMLKRMKRGSTRARQHRVVERLREKVPNLTFRTAFIVGHPGERDEDFEELCEFVRWAQFERMGVFRYSDEESAGSFQQDEKVSAKTIAARHRKLMSLQRGISKAKNKLLIGSELEVLVEGESEEHEFVMKGRHPGQAPEVDGQVFLSGDEARPGEMRRVRISQASDYDLVGELLPQDPSEAPKRRPRASLQVVR